jgi:hypothetical protein
MRIVVSSNWCCKLAGLDFSRALVAFNTIATTTATTTAARSAATTVFGNIFMNSGISLDAGLGLGNWHRYCLILALRAWFATLTTRFACFLGLTWFLILISWRNLNRTRFASFFLFPIGARLAAFAFFIASISVASTAPTVTLHVVPGFSFRSGWHNGFRITTEP